MIIEFDHTIADIKEALTPFDPKRPQRKSGAKRVMRVVPFVVLTASLAVLILLPTPPEPSSPPNPPEDVVTTVYLPFFPVLLIALLVGFSTIATARSPLPGSAAKPAGLLQLGMVVFTIALTAGAIFLVAEIRFVRYWNPSRMWLLAIFIGPWVVLLIVITWISRRNMVTSTWRKNDFLHRHVQAEFTNDRVRVSDPLVYRHAQWSYYVQARESDNLFLLHTRDANFLIVPKRAFAEEAMLDTFRALLAEKIAKCQFLVKPGGFPVQIAQTGSVEVAQTLHNEK